MIGRRIGWKALGVVCRSLAATLTAGIGIRKAVELAANKSHDSVARRALGEVSEAIAQGNEVSEAMRAQGRAFPELLVEMVALGEHTGALPEILKRLGEHYENNIRLRRTFLGMIAWPCIQLVLAILVVGGVIYILGWIAESRGGEPLDIFGLGLIGTRGALTWYALTFGSLFGLIGGYLLVSRSLSGKMFLDPVLMRVPVVGKCMRAFALARFSWAFSLTQQTGMPIERCLQVSLRATRNGSFIAGTRSICRAVAAGDELHEAFAASGLFPGEFLEMVYVGETSGTIPETLARLSPHLEEDARRTLAMLAAMLAWGVWLAVAAFIIFLIFSVVFWYLGMLNQAMGGR
ncbi:MAG: type II secretion system F family protein [Planctomycetaceae bacterium]